MENFKSFFTTQINIKKIDDISATEINWGENFYSNSFEFKEPFDLNEIETVWDLCEVTPGTSLDSLINIVSKFGLCYPNMEKNMNKIVTMKDTSFFIFSDNNELIKYGNLEIPSGTFIYIKNPGNFPSLINAPGVTQIMFINQLSPGKVFLKTRSRNRLATLIKKTVSSIFQDNDNFCINGKFADKEYLKIVRLQKLLGSGSYGNVFGANINNVPIAIKISKLPPKALTEKEKYSTKNVHWNEYNILNQMIAPVISNNICPNLPLIYSSFTCSDCVLMNIYKSGHSNVKICSVFLTELAAGDLSSWAEKKPTENEYKSCLFQLMAGLMVLQKYYQIITYDMKAENFLYHKVPAGGYWKYQINNVNYFVPNYGSLFIVNDFGTAISTKPESIFKEQPDYNYGCRPGVIMSDGKITKIGSSAQKSVKRIEVSLEPILPTTDLNSTIQLNTDQMNILNQRKIQTYFDLLNNPGTFPPFDFIFDTQDIINLFLNRHRTFFPRYSHTNIFTPKTIRDKLSAFHNPNVKYYNDDGDESTQIDISTKASQLSAEYFIAEYFRDETLFHYSQEKNIICEYNLDDISTMAIEE